MQPDCTLRIAGRGRLTLFSEENKTGGAVTSKSERCHLHKDQAQDALDRPVINKTATSDESRFNLSSDDNCVRVLKPRGERLDPAFALHRHTAPTAGVMVWGVIAYNTRSPLVLIRGTMTSCNHMCCHSCNGSQEPFFNMTMLGLTRQICIRTVTTLPWPTRSPDLSPTEHIWDNLGRRVEHPTSLNELEARLQQIWKEMSQVIIQNLYASMPILSHRAFTLERVQQRLNSSVLLPSPKPLV
ncbi:transposable element Tcb2 transposase [Trichonephila clavipes]|nr:transposable element Tcb2 transposase [Trichonephila clavipes]